MNYPMTDVEAREALVGEIYLLKKIFGYSAYELAVKHGFKGSEDEWLLSLTAYGLAVRNGFEGTLEEWISSLKGEKGDPGSLELFGEFDATYHQIANLAYPSADADAANKKYVDDVGKGVEDKVKKYVDDKNVASEEYVGNNFVAKESQLNANSMTIENVSAPVNDTDAVNKKYVHDTFQPIAAEDISSDFVAKTLNGFTVTSVKAIKQQNVISGELSIRGDFANLENGYISVAVIASKYKPLTKVVCPSLVQTTVDDELHLYLTETPNVWIDTLTGYVAVGVHPDNAGFTNDVVFSFTYLCK